MLLIELRRKRAEINDEIQALASVEKESGELSAEQLEQFTQLTAEFDKLTAQINRLESSERMQATTAKPVATYAASEAPVVIASKPEAKQYTGAKMARMVMSIAASEGDLTDAAKFARNEIGDADVAMAIETSAGSGGALIPQNMYDEVIELLRARTVVRRLGAQIVPLPNGNLSIPRHSSGATSGFVGEGADVLATEAEFDDVKLSAKTMITLVPMSNQLIGRAGFNVESLVLNDMLGAMSVREDKAFLRDDGTNNTPTGFKKTATDAVGRTVSWSGSFGLNAVDAYLDALMLKLLESDSLMIRPGWAMSPRTYMKLFGLRDGNGNKVYPEMSQGQLKGFPIYHTTTIPVNLGAGSNESEIYFADWNDVVIGEMENMKVDFSREATYKDSNGQLVSAFARNQSLIRVVGEIDIGFRHPEGIVLGTGVTW